MSYELDENYNYQYYDGRRVIPSTITRDKDGLIVLPNGKYMPSGIYFDKERGLDIIYEPYELTFAKNVRYCIDED